LLVIVGNWRGTFLVGVDCSTSNRRRSSLKSFSVGFSTTGSIPVHIALRLSICAATWPAGSLSCAM
jgi:hypothetical protein